MTSLAEQAPLILGGELKPLAMLTGRGDQTVVDALLNVLGSEGTLVVPTFGDLGVLTHLVREDPRAVHSVHPKACVAAIGADAERICRDHWKAETAHGEAATNPRG